MDWLSFSDVPWLGVLIAFIATFVLGWFWYSPSLFFKPWQRAVGFTDDDMKNANMASSFGQMILGNALGVIALGVLFVPLGVDSWWAGLLTGAILGVVFRWGAHWVHDGFALRKPLATLIDGAHDTLALGVAGAIIGAFL